MMELLSGTIADLRQAYCSRQVSPLEVCTEILDRIERYDAEIGSFLRIDRERFLKDARAAKPNDERPLAGVPIAIKDNISTAGLETTAGSKILKGYIPPFDATVIDRLRQAGALIIGKTNCDEFGMGSSTENSAFQLTYNPWNTEFAPGGSSGGSAAAVASCFAFAALGSDTGGSVRQPASLCGVIGLKPSYARVSRNGLVAFGSSLDCIGSLTRSVKDAALLLKVIAGHDPEDSTSVSAGVPDYPELLQQSSKRLKVGVPREYFSEGMDPEVAASVQAAIRDLENDGAIELKTISLPHSSYAISAYYVIATAEASSNLSRYDGVRYGLRVAGNEPLGTMYSRTRASGFGAEVKRRVMLGTFALSSGYYDAYYLQASRVRSLIAQDFQNAFAEVDLICAPTSPTSAFRLGEKVNDPLSMYLSDVYTVTSSLAGLPAISVPCGRNSAGLPVGLQIIGNYLEEAKVFSLADSYLMSHPLELPELETVVAKK